MHKAKMSAVLLKAYACIQTSHAELKSNLQDFQKLHRVQYSTCVHAIQLQRVLIGIIGIELSQSVHE